MSLTDNVLVVVVAEDGTAFQVFRRTKDGPPVECTREFDLRPCVAQFEAGRPPVVGFHVGHKEASLEQG